MSLSSVLTMGFQPSGNINLIVTLGYGLTGAIPPPPIPDVVQRYGPALTPAERRRWFGDFESPLSRAARRKLKEYLCRVEFGILTPEVKEELVEKASLAIPKTAEVILKARPEVNKDRIVNAVMKQMKAEIAIEMEKRRLIMDEEEEEDIVVISTFMMSEFLH